MDSANVLLLPAIIAENLACHLDATTDGRIGYHAPLPDRPVEFIPSNQPAAIAGKVNQQLDHLRLCMNGLAALQNLETVGIQHKLLK